MAATTTNRKRPRLDMNTDARERKRGKSMFGLVLGTLNKAKNEDKERNASDVVRLLYFIPLSSCVLTAVLLSLYS